MTHDEILNMPAGQDMDMLIAENVLMLDNNGWNELFFHNRTKFSTDISAAWEVVEKIESIGKSWEMWANTKEPLIHVRIGNKRTCRAVTAPLAICRAALLAVMK